MTGQTTGQTVLVEKRFLTGALKGLRIVDRVPVGYPVGQCIREALTGNLVYVTRRAG
jgi:hypothetical protein